LIKALNDSQHLQWCDDRSQHISQEKVPKTDKAEWRDNDVPHGQPDVLARAKIAAVQWAEADQCEQASA
jgi:hypothetical protein